MSQQLQIIDWQSNDLIVNEVSPSDKEGRLKARAKIEEFQLAFQNAIGSEKGEMEEINNDGLKEYFVDGSYTRQLFIPKGIASVSEIWKKERLWIIATGEVTITTEMGTKRIKAPHTEVVPLGSKVALYTHEDTLWFAVTGTEAKTPTDVKDEMIAADYSDCVYAWDKLEGEKS